MHFVTTPYRWAMMSRVSSCYLRVAFPWVRGQVNKHRSSDNPWTTPDTLTTFHTQLKPLAFQGILFSSFFKLLSFCLEGAQRATNQPWRRNQVVSDDRPMQPVALGKYLRKSKLRWFTRGGGEGRGGAWIKILYAIKLLCNCGIFSHQQLICDNSCLHRLVRKF